MTILALLLACGGATLSPFRGHMEVGRDPYVLFVGDGPDGRSDLWASRPNGSDLVQVTFGAALEKAPAISPDGSVVAFLRRVPADSSGVAQVWLLNLLNGAEREVKLPRRAPPHIERLGWSRDGRTLYLAGAGSVWRVAAPPAPADLRPITAAETPAADSALRVLLGDPPIARAERCAGGQGVCAVADSGAATTLAADGHDPVRWGTDSVGYFEGDVLVVRPLGAGRTREIRWTRGPGRPRGATYFPGARNP